MSCATALWRNTVLSATCIPTLELGLRLLRRWTGRWTAATSPLFLIAATSYTPSASPTSTCSNSSRGGRRGSAQCTTRTLTRQLWRRANPTSGATSTQLRTELFRISEVAASTSKKMTDGLKDKGYKGFVCIEQETFDPSHAAKDAVINRDMIRNIMEKPKPTKLQEGKWGYQEQS